MRNLLSVVLLLLSFQLVAQPSPTTITGVLFDESGLIAVGRSGMWRKLPAHFEQLNHTRFLTAIAHYGDSILVADRNSGLFEYTEAGFEEKALIKHINHILVDGDTIALSTASGLVLLDKDFNVLNTQSHESYVFKTVEAHSKYYLASKNGVYSFNGKAYETIFDFEKVNTKFKTDFKSLSVSDIVIVNDLAYLATKQGLFQISLYDFTKIVRLTNEGVNKLAYDGKNLHLGMANNSLKVYEIDSGRLTDNEQIHHKKISTIYMLEHINGNLLVGMESGLHIITPKTPLVLRPSVGEAQRILVKVYDKFYIWVSGRGLYEYDPGEDKIIKQVINSSLVADNIAYLEGNIYLSSLRGMFIYDAQTFEPKRSHIGLAIIKMKSTEEGVYFTGDTGAVTLIKNQESRRKKYFEFSEYAWYSWHGSVNDVTRVGEGEWFLATDEGVKVVSKKNGVFTQITSLRNIQVQSILVKDATVYVASLNDGIFVYDLLARETTNKIDFESGLAVSPIKAMSFVGDELLVAHENAVSSVNLKDFSVKQLKIQGVFSYQPFLNVGDDKYLISSEGIYRWKRKQLGQLNFPITAQILKAQYVDDLGNTVNSSQASRFEVLVGSSLLDDSHAVEVLIDDAWQPVKGFVVEKTLNSHIKSEGQITVRVSVDGMTSNPISVSYLKKESYFASTQFLLLVAGVALFLASVVVIAYIRSSRKRAEKIEKRLYSKVSSESAIKDEEFNKVIERREKFDTLQAKLQECIQSMEEGLNAGVLDELKVIRERITSLNEENVVPIRPSRKLGEALGGYLVEFEQTHKISFIDSIDPNVTASRSVSLVVCELVNSVADFAVEFSKSKEILITLKGAGFLQLRLLTNAIELNNNQLEETMPYKRCSAIAERFSGSFNLVMTENRGIEWIFMLPDGLKAKSSAKVFESVTRALPQ